MPRGQNTPPVSIPGGQTIEAKACMAWQLWWGSPTDCLDSVGHTGGNDGLWISQHASVQGCAGVQFMFGLTAPLTALRLLCLMKRSSYQLLVPDAS